MDAFEQFADLPVMDTEFLGTLLSTPAILLLISFILELLCPLSSLYNLKSLIPVYRQLALKVNGDHRSLKEKYFAGFMLPLLIAAMILMLVMLLLTISGFDVIISIVLLYMLLERGNVSSFAAALAKALKQDRKDQGRSVLKKLVLRDTGNLSAMGLSKAGCETIILRLFNSYFAIMIWYLILGDIGAVLMGLSVSLNYAFNCKLVSYQSFGLFSSKLYQCLLYVPALAFGVLCLIAAHPLENLKKDLDDAKLYPCPVTGFILASVGAALDLSLGGPRFYEGTKIYYAKVGGTGDPKPEDLKRCLKFVKTRVYLLLIIAAGAAVLSSPQLTGQGYSVPDSAQHRVERQAVPGLEGIGI